ncbi:MAG TPA: thrombospondin type 3 repeat-containing protein, partial [Verrucomicrobiae bacterium]|nr:thrombospondin type 3 repeat-containing protein [Verrucomicrobiae bacterium]
TALTIDPTDSIGFINRGTLQANATCTLYVSGAGFSNFVAATATLTGGTYRVAGTLKFDNASIVNNAATIVLDGAAAAIVNQTAVNALTVFATNTGAGIFIVTNGARFATAKPFVNLGGIQLRPGGVMAGYSNLVNGNIACSAPATIDITGGSLSVTNTAHDAVLEVRSGTLTLSAGLLAADKLVITSACARFIQSGGTFMTNVVVLAPGLDADGDGLPNGWEQQYGLDPFDPTGNNGANGDPDGDGFTNLQEYLTGTDPTDSASFFRITAIGQEANDIRVTWLTGIGKTNALQFTQGDPSGGHATNFVDLFTVTNTVGTVTNYLDVGAATNTPARYYRVRLVP